jgi:hypothetical protein
MENYWGSKAGEGSKANGAATATNGSAPPAPAATAAPIADDDIDMIE